MSQEHWLRKVVREYFESVPPEKRHHAELSDMILDVNKVRNGQPLLAAACPSCSCVLYGNTREEADLRLETHRKYACGGVPI